MKRARVAVGVLLVVLGSVLSLPAATYVVTQSSDSSATGTLRWAITSANASAGSDTVSFNMAVPTITATGQMPRVDGANTIIDGTTQGGYSPGAPIVRLHGNPNISRGLGLYGPTCTVRALVVTGFKDEGIFLATGRYAVVQGCHLLSNGYAGISVAGSGHTIGGTNAAQRNVISANTNGIYLSPNFSNTTVIGNFIGTDASGTAGNGNLQDGIQIAYHGGNRIGSTTNGARNVISGNGGAGIHIMYTNSAGNIIENNCIGAASNGTSALGNGGQGIFIESCPSNRIGGTSAAARNIIGANYEGIRIDNEGSVSNFIQGNYIGIGEAGAMLSNLNYGVRFQAAPSNTIGGAVAGAGNVIGGGSYAIYLSGTNTCGTVIQGNRIGTDPAGSARRHVEYNGIYLADSRNTQIGGTSANARNVISGCGMSGITSQAGAGGGHVIEGNYIGTDATGMFSISNRLAGVSLSVPYCRIGGTNAASRNVISGNGDGVTLGGTNAHYIRVFGNYIGVDVTGTGALGNGGFGVSGSGIHHCEIGKGVAGCGNVIAGNTQSGISLTGGCYENLIANNLIGLDASGLGVLPNSSGVYISNGGPTNSVGGSISERNIVAGNRGHGIYAGFSTGVVIRSNYVGLDASLSPAGNTNYGIYVQWSRDFDVGGSLGLQGNIVGGNGDDGIVAMRSTNGYVRNNYSGYTGSGAAGNRGDGIDIQGSRAVEVRQNTVVANGGSGIQIAQGWHVTIANNYIGTDNTGAAGLGNTNYGVQVWGPAETNTIGGTDGASGNTISGNDWGGVFLNGSDIRYTVIAGNWIGTDPWGQGAVPNDGIGVQVYGSPFVTIGGTNPGARNIISGNYDRGVAIGECYSNFVQGNIIGADVTGTNPIPNAEDGVYIGAGASNNLVGSMDTNGANLIAFNRLRGILVYDSGAGTARGNLFLGNSIKRNERMGIDLGWDDVTANDPGDPDLEENRLQNYPVLLGATNDGANITVWGYLDSLPSTAFSIELFGNRDPDLTGYGEGEYLIGRVAVVTPAGGTVGFTQAVSTAAGTPNFITATASAMVNGDTSEFSRRLLLDSDGDGLGDGFEFEYYGHHTGADPAGDDDFDHMNNLAEFVCETDPWDGNSSLRATAFWREFDNNYYQLASSDCRNYVLQFTWDLNDTPSVTWWDQWSSVVRTNGSVTLTTSTSGDAIRFYRFWASIP